MERKFFAVDIFCGAGGLSTGFEKHGFHTVFATDKWSDACKTFQLNHKDTHVICDSIEKISAERIFSFHSDKKIHVLLGGPPCQGFSTVGKKEKNDPRNYLFEHYFRILSELKPLFFVFENVVGLKTMYHGEFYKIILEKFQTLNYCVQNKILNAYDFGVPQKRNRLFIVGYQKGLQFEWPKPTDEKETVFTAISDLPLVYFGKEANNYLDPCSNYQKQRRKNCQILTEHKGPNHSAAVVEILKYVPPGGNVTFIPESVRPKKCFSTTYGRLEWNKPSGTITRNFTNPGCGKFIHPQQHRGLTIREGARLQSFDDDYVFYGNTTSKALQIGNAVPPLLAEALAKQIANYLS
ncbi:MAG: DNA cytosine methyltransferase [Candidatus Dojkabacteria bacterium]|nr:DNA cytosine methyltransferase [Candidatus Dojkabacteria bacterium]